MKNGEIWKESSKTYHLPWLSLVTGEFNVVHCYAEKVSTDEADVKPCTTAARARDQASACCALWRPFPVLLRTDICFALENRWSIVSFAEPGSCYQPQWRKRRKRKKPFCEAYCDNPSTSSCHTVIWCPIPGLSSDPKLLKQVVWAGCSDRSGWWERDCSRTVRNKILSNAACAAYEPETASPTATNHSTASTSCLCRWHSCRWDIYIAYGAHQTYGGCWKTEYFTSFQQQTCECMWIQGSSHQTVIAFRATVISISIAMKRLMYYINKTNVNVACST